MPRDLHAQDKKKTTDFSVVKFRQIALSAGLLRTNRWQEVVR